jgi:BASS family bile acid:Na+ symporter
VFLGLLFPPLAALFKPLLAPAVALLLSVAMVRIDWRDVATHGRRLHLSLAALFWLTIGSAVLMWGFCRLLDVPPAFTMALVLMAAAPPVTSSIAIAQIVRLDAALVLLGTLSATLAVPLTLPPLSLELLGLPIELSLLELSGRLALMVGGAVAGSLLLRWWLGKEGLVRHAVALDGVTVILMLTFGIAIMDGVTAAAFADPVFIFKCVVISFAANIALQLAGAGAFFWLGRRGAISMALPSGNRNMGLLLSVLGSSAAPEAVLYFAIGQLPIYMLPAILSPIYRKASQR